MQPNAFREGDEKDSVCACLRACVHAFIYSKVVPDLAHVSHEWSSCCLVLTLFIADLIHPSYINQSLFPVCWYENRLQMNFDLGLFLPPEDQ